MDVQWVDHVNLRIPADRTDEFVALYRDDLGLELEHLEDYRAVRRDFFYRG